MISFFKRNTVLFSSPLRTNICKVSSRKYEHLFQFLLVAICISISVPAGVFVPSFVIGAAIGRLVGETVSAMFPDGFRGVDGPQIYPGLYAIVGR